MSRARHSDKAAFLIELNSRPNATGIAFVTACSIRTEFGCSQQTKLCTQTDSLSASWRFRPPFRTLYLLRKMAPAGGGVRRKISNALYLNK